MQDEIQSLMQKSLTQNSIEKDLPQLFDGNIKKELSIQSEFNHYFDDYSIKKFDLSVEKLIALKHWIGGNP